MTDPIADLLTRIRNASRARHATVCIPVSHLKEGILQILKEKGYISNFIREDVKPTPFFKVFLKYGLDKKAVITTLKRISRPGRRVYMGYRQIQPTLRGIGVAILSTPKGILTDQQARKEKVGGEVLCEVD